MPHRLVYMSSTTWRVEPGDLVEILDASRRNNKRDGITGALIYHNGNFLQVLQGEEDKVMACYRRIGADPRHRGCLITQSDPVESRNFGVCDMASIPFTQLSPENRDGFIELQDLFATWKGRGLAQDYRVDLFLCSFLERFRNLRPA